MTTDNMRKTIGKTNYLITFTTAYPGVTFYRATVVSTATSGTFRGMHLHVTGSGIGANVTGLRVEAHSAALTTGISWLIGARIKAECDSASYVAAFMIGLYLAVEAASDSTVECAFGLYLDYGVLCAVGNFSTFIYLRNNAPTQHPTAYMTFYGGATHFFYFNSTSQGEAAGATGDVTANVAGYLLIDWNGMDRYVQLYEGPPT